MTILQYTNYIISLSGVIIKKIIILILISIGLNAEDYTDGLNPYTDKKYQTEKIYLEASAKEGNSSAQYYLATLYDKGMGVPINRKTALKWYMEAERNGDKMAIKRMDTLRNNTKTKFFEIEKPVTLFGIKITLSINTILDTPSGGEIIYRVNFNKGSHSKEVFTDSSDKGTFEFLNYRIKFYNLDVTPKVTVTKW